MGAMTHPADCASRYQSYLDFCNQHDFDSMASFYTPTIKVDDAPMDPAAVTDQFTAFVVGFPDWHWDMRHIVVDDHSIVVHFTVSGTHLGSSTESRRPVAGCPFPSSPSAASRTANSPRSGTCSTCRVCWTRSGKAVLRLTGGRAFGMGRDMSKILFTPYLVTDDRPLVLRNACSPRRRIELRSHEKR